MQRNRSVAENSIDFNVTLSLERVVMIEFYFNGKFYLIQIKTNNSTYNMKNMYKNHLIKHFEDLRKEMSCSLIQMN